MAIKGIIADALSPRALSRLSLSFSYCSVLYFYAIPSDERWVLPRPMSACVASSADGIALEGFTATEANESYPEAGIKVTSSNNTLSGNNASNNYYGIYLV